jgi:hypothetical protein
MRPVYRRITKDTPEWRLLVDQLADRADVREAITDLSGTMVPAWLRVSGVIEELEVELDPLERMLLQGDLIRRFFPDGVPRISGEDHK